MRWFFFGSLLDPDVQRLVIGHDTLPRQEPGFLHGYRRVRVIDETYPALRPQPGGRVPGLIVHGLDDDASRRICFFEGEEFVPHRHSIERADGSMTDALVFIATGTGIELDDRPWDFARWQTTHKPDFLEMARDFMAGYGQADWHELDAQWTAAQQSHFQRRYGS